MLEENKRNWHRNLINALWAERVSSKKSIGMSPFELVYGTDVVFPVGVPMFWPDWQDQKMRQHQNHFGALGSSPPGPGEGSLQIEQRMIYL